MTHDRASASPFIDLLSAYERLSSRIVEWAPSDSSEDALPRTERSDQELFHREVRRQVMNDGGRRYVFMVRDQAMRSAGHEPFADSQRAHVDIRVLPTSSLGTPGPFTVFEAGNRPVAVALRHDHSTTYGQLPPHGQSASAASDCLEPGAGVMTAAVIYIDPLAIHPVIDGEWHRTRLGGIPEPGQAITMFCGATGTAAFQAPRRTPKPEDPPPMPAL